MYSFSRKALCAAALFVAPQTVFAGLLRHDIDLQTYRDFAENRGEFAAGNTASVYNSAGVFTGTVVMPNFDSLVDDGYMTLAGSAQTLATVAHMNSSTGNSFTFTERFAGGGSTYRNIYLANTTGYDFGMTRLNKLVTEAPVVALMTDTARLTNLAGKTLVRAGSGYQEAAISGQTTTTLLSGAGEMLTGGTVVYSSYNQSVNNGNTVYSSAFTFTEAATTPNATNPIAIGTKGGDSGSPTFGWNSTTGRYELVATNSGGGGTSGYGKATYQVYAPEWYLAQLASFNSPTVAAAAGQGNLVWGVADASGNGTLTQGATTWSFTGLANQVRGGTSTLAADGVSTAEASDAQYAATKNLIFAGAGGTIVLSGSVDMGAGNLTFAADTTLTDGGVNIRRLNTAGYIVNAGVTVTTELTGAAGDEWRKIGPGTLVIAGTGENYADLEVGGEGDVELNRTGGQAAQNVRIVGGVATVRIKQAEEQVRGSVNFGHRGGTLDLNGFSRTWAAIHAVDAGANIANYGANTTSTFTHTGSGNTAYLGSFSDGGTLAAGLLNVVYSPTTASGAVWNLSGDITNKGTWTVNGGEVRVAGVPTLHAGGYVDPNDRQTATFDTGTVTVNNGGVFTAGAHAVVGSAVSVNAGGAFRLFDGANHTGAVALNASTAQLKAEITTGTVTEAGLVSGTGSLVKTGLGTLVLTHAGNTLSGAHTVTGGTLRATSLAALGSGSGNWLVSGAGQLAVDGATAATVKAKISTGSTGTLALSGASPDGNPDMTGRASLFLGAVGNVTVGASNTSTNLIKWAGGNTGWNLGGGDGQLTMNLKLSGTGTLTIGNGLSRGEVILTNSKNATTTGGARFDGQIVVNPGVVLSAANNNAFGRIGSNDRLTVNYGGMVSLGAQDIAANVFSIVQAGSTGILAIKGADANTYNFTTVNNAALGAFGSGTYSGALTPGSAGYRFGGNGALAVASALTGARAVIADGQAFSTGVTTLAGANTFTGAVTVQGGELNGLTGTHILRAGSAGALGASTALVTNAGGVLDLNGYAKTVTTLSGTGGGIRNDNTATASTFTASIADAQTSGAALGGGAGVFNVIKSGAGTLTLTGTTHDLTGTLAVNAGTLRLGGASTLEATGGVSIASGATLDLASGANQLTTTRFSGAGNLVKSGSGTLTIKEGAVSTLTGAVTVSGGTLALLDQSALNATSGITVNSGATFEVAYSSINGQELMGSGTSGFTLNGGRFLANDRSFFWRGINLNAGDQAVEIGAGADFYLYYSGFFAGSGNLVKNGAGSLVIAGANSTFTGTTTVNAGAVIFGGGASMFSATSGVSVASGATLRFEASERINNNAALALDGTLEFKGAFTETLAGLAGGALAKVTNTVADTAATLVVGGNNADTTYAGLLENGLGTLAFTKNGTGVQTLSGANTHTGATTVNAGTLRLGSATAFGGRGALTVATGATFDANGHAFETAALAGDGALALGAGVATVNNAAANTFSGVISGAGSLVKNGAGTLTLSGPSDYAGGTTLNAGTLTASLGTTAGARTVFGTGAITANAGTTLRFFAGSTANAMSHANALNLNGATLVSEDAVQTYTGALALTGASTVNVVWSGKNALFTGVASGTGSLTKTGSGTLVLTGANTYDGGTTVNGGTLTTSLGTTGGARSAFGAGAITANTGTTLRFFAGSTANAMSHANALNLNGATLIAEDAVQTFTGAVALTGANTVNVVWSGKNATLAGVVSGAGSLTKTGSGALTLAAINTFTGGATVHGGTLRLNNGGQTGVINGAVTVNAGATLELAAGDATGWGAGARISAITLNGGTLHVSTTANQTLSNAALTLSGASITGVAGSNLDLFNNGTSLTGLASATTSVIATTSMNLRQNDTVFTVAQGTTTSGIDLQVTANLGNGSAGNHNLVKNGAGTMRLAGTNTYTGTSTVNGGTLLAGANNAFGTGAITVNAGGTLNSGLTGTAFTLNNAVTVNTGGTLKGAGALTKAVTFNAGAVVAPGNSPGITTFAAGGAFAAGAIYEWELQGMAPTVAGVDFDQIVVSGGALSISPGAILKVTALGIDYSGAYWDVARTFVYATASGTGAFTGAFTLDTTAAGNFADRGAWTLVGDSNNLHANWTVSAGNNLNANWAATSAIPEPATSGLIGAAALAGLSLVRRRRGARR